MTINLDDNKIPFGLLSKEEQEHLRNWPHGLLYYEGGNSWWPCEPQSLHDYYIYRTIPAPKRETVWVYHDDLVLLHVCDDRLDAKDTIDANGGIAFRIEFDATTGDNPTITKETFDEV